MNEIALLNNTIMPYAWGSHTAIAELLGQAVPSAEPQAELWMGAHPKAPSMALVDGRWRPLPEVIEQATVEVLGANVAQRFSGKLPFLFKVLSAATPLSIQAHPSLGQAREGYAKENRLGIPLAAPDRNYRDDNHKPEIICALTPFYAMNGFRRLPEMIDLLQLVSPPTLVAEIDALTAQPDRSGLELFYSAIMTMNRSRQEAAVAEVAGYAQAHSDEDAVFEWIGELQREYPGDIGVLSPLLLNVVKLEPGQAMYSQARQLHAYLLGTGIELMANSDNVLRGGLTPKHVDVPELLSVLDFSEADINILEGEMENTGERFYASTADEFRLSAITAAEGRAYNSALERSVEILICTEGEAVVENMESGFLLRIGQGDSFLVPAAVPAYRLEGKGRLFKAFVPQ